MHGIGRSLRLLILGFALWSGRAARAEPAPAPVAPVPAAPATGAGTPAGDEVAEHVAQGRRLYLLGHYQEAIGEYRRAYELRADPQFLLDTAEAYRQLGATDQALFYYDRYLAAAPNAPNREIVEDRVTELELLRTPAIRVVTPGGGDAARPKPTPLWKRWWLWTAVGVAVGAGITAALVASRSTSPAIPPTDLGNGKFY
ncbi:MAG TPA: tetratricopeptide repeat protein [Polyangia bacterium]|nr:tetratricopeptide repeat protein [Polyangia bacterium]